MKIELDISGFDIQEGHEPWKWSKILCSLDYVPLQKPTSLQWVILKILLHRDTLSNDLNYSMVAKNLGVEKRIIDEGITNLVDLQYVSVKSRKDKDVLANYDINPFVKLCFQKTQSVPGIQSQQKIFLYHRKDNIFSFQIRF